MVTEVQMFVAADGKQFTTQREAEDHEVRRKYHEKFDAYFKQLGYKRTPRAKLKLLLDWEHFKTHT